MLDLKYIRSRVWLAGLILAVIAVGLASRKYPAMLPAALGSYPGDALWAVVVYLGIAFIKPDIVVWRLAGVALGVSYLVEVVQLYQAPWINSLRGTTLGHLVLGAGFDWLDLGAQTVGVALGTLVDATCALRGAGVSRRG